MVFCSLSRTFVAQNNIIMPRLDKWTNVILALLAAMLLVVCVLTIGGQMKASSPKNLQEYAGNSNK